MMQKNGMIGRMWGVKREMRRKRQNGAHFNNALWTRIEAAHMLRQNKTKKKNPDDADDENG